VISVTCSKCGNELDETGALYFGPPSGLNFSAKEHICRDCDRLFVQWLGTGHDPEQEAEVWMDFWNDFWAERPRLLPEMTDAEIDRLDAWLTARYAAPTPLRRTQ